MLESFKELFETFEAMVLSSEDLFPSLILAINGVYSDFTESMGSNAEELLQYISGKREHFSDLFLEVQVIRMLGSDIDRKVCEMFERECEMFERRCDRYFLNIAFKYNAQFLEEKELSIELILDRGKEDSESIVSSFKSELTEAFSITRESMKMKYDEFGLQFLSVQIPKQFQQEFVFSPLYSDKLSCLMKQRVQFAMIDRHKYFLAKWRIFQDGEITVVDKTKFSHGCNNIFSVKHKNMAYMALEYSPELERDEGFLQYLECILNHHHKHIPAIKGLYYPSQSSMFQYPWVVMEECEPLLKSVTNFPVKEVNQVSFLLDIVHCFNEFKNSDPPIVFKVGSIDSIYAYHEKDKLKARILPLYGFSCNAAEKENIHREKSLTTTDLHWMLDVTRFLHNGPENSPLPENHIMKKLLEQKWLSKEVRFQPQSYKHLCEDLEDFHGRHSYNSVVQDKIDFLNSHIPRQAINE